jgi:predicted nucleic acid-binding protein
MIGTATAMPSDLAFDTNVLVYWAAQDPVKAPRSEQIVLDGAMLSVQVLNEFCRVALSKLKKPLPEVRLILDTVRLTNTIVPITLSVHERGLKILQRYRLAVFDSMIVAAALDAGCTTLWSEDMHDGLVIDGLTIRNPYR